MDAARSEEVEALEVAVEGMARCAELAQIALERGDRATAAGYVLGAVSDLEPELAELKRRHGQPRPTLRITLPQPVGSVRVCALLACTPLAILALQSAFPVLRLAGFSPYVLAVAAAAHLCGFRAAVVTLMVTVGCTAYTLALTQTEPYEWGLRVALSTGAMLILARWLSDGAPHRLHSRA